MSEQPRSTTSVARGRPLLAWMVILGTMVFVLFRQAGRFEGEVAVWLVPMQMQARYIVGAFHLGIPGISEKQAYRQARRTLAGGPYGQRLRFAVLAGELAGPEEALEVLEEMEKDHDAGTLPARPESVETARWLRQLYTGYKKGEKQPRLGETEQQELTERLGWFGELALAPEGGDPQARRQALAPALRTATVYLVVTAAVLAGVGLGGFALTLFVLLVVAGRLHGGLEPGAGFGGIYAETFAIYLLLYLALGCLLGFLPRGDWGLLLNLVAMLGSLLALLWPVLRGASWAQVRRDLGLHGGERPGVEVLLGFGTYLCAIPVLVAGLLLILAILQGQRWLGLGGEPFRPGNTPSHPVVAVALSGSIWVWVQLFLVACVAAPLVEEIMFRGLLYRHLREASTRWGKWISTGVSATGTALVFAIIHPQGWLGVPVLMGLAIVFALAREWRRSLLAPCIAHGLNNGLVSLLLLTTAG